MVFASHFFLYVFLPIFLVLYFATPSRFRSPVIALGSYVFYGFWIPWFLLPMFISTVVDWVVGERIASARKKSQRGTPWLVLSMVSNLGLLGYFKYANFFVGNFNELMVARGMPPVAWVEVILPVGISFYTFQTMSYAIDVWRGDAEKVKSFGDFMCFVALFPQLVAGPIVRYASIAKDLAFRQHSWMKFSQGAMLFQIGFAKKILIADNLEPLARTAFDAVGRSTPDAWIGLFAYTFQIYFDFSGYSDMAIGLGLMLGFSFPINFDQPYRAIGITDFWRRWHISLSTWLRDYLYIPLGGNRKGVVRTYVNLALVMILGGFWHGANWTFIAWGAWQGFWLILERAFGKKSLYGWLPQAWQIAATFFIAMMGWVFFRSEGVIPAINYFSDLFGVGAGRPLRGLDLNNLHIVAFLAAAICVWTCPTSQKLASRGATWFVLLLQVFFFMAIAHLHFQVHVPFIYFQF